MDPQTCLCPPRSDPTVSYLHVCIGTISWTQNVPMQSFTSGSQSEIIWQISSVDIIPESSSICHSCSNGISETGPAISPTAFNQSFSSELFKKSLQNRCSHFGWIRCQQCGLHFRNSWNLFPELLSCARQCSSLMLIFDVPTVCEEDTCCTHILIGF